MTYSAITDMAPEVLLAVLAIYLLAGMVKGAMGFGLPIVSVSLLPFVVPVATALALNAIVLVLTNIQQIRQGGAYRAGFGAAWPVMAGMLCGVPVGAVLAADLSPDSLMLVLGLFILLFVGLSIARPELEVPPHRRVPISLGSGIASGIVGALTSSPAAIFVMVMVALKLDRSVFVTALGFIMALFGAAAAVAYAVTGTLGVHHFVPGLAAVPPAMLGMWLGNRWASQLGSGTFRKAVLGLLAILAIVMIRRSMT